MPLEVQAGVHRPIGALDLTAVFFQRLLELGMLVTDHDRAHVRIGELLELQTERGKHIRIGDEAPSIALTTSIRSPRHAGNCVARGRQNLRHDARPPVIASHEARTSSPNQERRLWRRHRLGLGTAKGRQAASLYRGSSDDLPSCSILLLGDGARIRSPRCFLRGKQRKRHRFDGQPAKAEVVELPSGGRIVLGRGRNAASRKPSVSGRWSVRRRWDTCDMSLKAHTNTRHVARGLEQRAPVKRPRTGGHRPGPDTEEVTLSAPEP